MTPKLKAKELVEKYYHLFSVELENTIADYEAKECALIAVDEILTINDERPYMLSGFKETFYKEVKKEIEKL
jgi:hypothetical protein